MRQGYRDGYLPDKWRHYPANRSEHNAIFQVWAHQHQQAINSITLTASGGPFLHASQQELAEATASQALRHPNWNMGKKISIDSATMMNKGLEVIEACVLFDLPEDRVKVVVHPQSIIHGLVNYADGSMLAQLGPADMRVPLSYVLAWPDRLPWATDSIDLTAIGQFDLLLWIMNGFQRLIWAAGMAVSGLASAILNAANEVAVAAFLDHQIGFKDIVASIDHALSSIPSASLNHLDDVLAVDMETKACITTWLKERK